MKQRDVTDLIVDSLAKHHEWNAPVNQLSDRVYRVEHVPSGITLWIASGADGLDFKGSLTCSLGYWSRRRIYKAVQRMLRAKVAVAIGGAK